MPCLPTSSASTYGVTYHLLPKSRICSLETNNHWHAMKVLRCGDDRFGYHIAPSYTCNKSPVSMSPYKPNMLTKLASLDVDENCANPLITQDELEGFNHSFFRGLPTTVKEVGASATVLSNSIICCHSQASSIHKTASSPSTKKAMSHSLRSTP